MPPRDDDKYDALRYTLNEMAKGWYKKGLGRYETDGVNNAFSIPLATIMNVCNADLCSLAPDLREVVTLKHMLKLYDTENVYEGE